MRTCEYCHIELPEDAAFCGSCGHVQSAKMPSSSASSFESISSDEFGTVVMSPSLEQGTASASDRPTIISATERELDPLAGRNLRNMNRSIPFSTSRAPQERSTPVPDTPGIAEEEKGSAAFFNRVFPPVVGAEETFRLQNSGPAPIGAGSSMPQQFSSSAPGPAYYPPAPGNFIAPPYSGMPQPQSPAQTRKIPRGYFLWGAILLVPLLILSSIIGLSITVFAPVITLSGNTTISSGDILHVRGRSFLGNATITLTVDDNRPVQMMADQESTPSDLQQSSVTQNHMLLLGEETNLATAAILKTSSNGTFNADIMANTNWSPGIHQLRAQESVSQRSASLTFTIRGQSDALPPATTVTPVQKSGPIPTSVVQNTPVPTLPATIPAPANTPVPQAPIAPAPTPTPVIVSTLTSLTPNTLNLGTLSQGSGQGLTGQTTLNASGNAMVAWTATWNQQQAPWLQVSPSSGQISMPGSQQISVTASAGTLQPGNYSTTVSFASPSNAQPLTLSVSFSVQGFCLKGRPGKLAFTANAGGPDPATQNIDLVNCGIAGSWTATTATADGTNWLAVNPANGTLASGAKQALAVSVAAVNTKLAAGTYTGTITITSGTSQFQVAVKLTVQSVVNQSPPALQVTPASINLRQKQVCLPTGITMTGIMYTCKVQLTVINAMQPVTWAVTPGKLTTANPASGTIAPGAVATILLQISSTTCPGTNDTIVFTSATTSSVSVTLMC